MKYFFYNILFLFVANVCSAQQQYTFTNYTQEQGLPIGTISAMCIDSSGYLWLFDEQSIVRFDGYNFKVFQHDPDDSTSIPNGSISNYWLLANGDIHIKIDQKSRLYDARKLSFTKQLAYKDTAWIGESFMLKSDSKALYFFSNKNLIRVNNSAYTCIPLPENTDINDKHKIASDDTSNFIMVNNFGKVFVFKANAKSFEQIKIYDRSGKPDTTVFDILWSGEENNFIAISKKHLYRFSKKPDRFIPALDLHQSGFSGHLYRNKYFAFTNDGKLYKLNISTGEEKFIYLNKKIPEDEIKNKYMNGVIDKKGMLWVISADMGLFRYDTNTDQYEQFIHEPGNPGSIPFNSSILSILPGDEGMAWIAIYGYGLLKIEPVVPVMEHLRLPVNKKEIFTGENTKDIRTFLETESGYLVGSHGGLFNYDAAKKEFSKMTGPFGPGPKYIGSLARDRSGNIWVGTWEGYLYILNPKNNRRISPELFLPSNVSRVRDLFCDSKNTMWIATEGDGIYTVNVNEVDFNNPASLKFNHISHKEKNASFISSGTVYTITEDEEGNIWAGTDNGLNRYDRLSKKWIHYTNVLDDEHSLHGDDVRSLAFDKKGVLWIGTNGGGLNRYNKAENNFTHFTTKNGLPDNAVYTILCDNSGMLWLGTNYGLCRFNPDDYSCKKFTMKDGLQNYEYNTEAAYKLKDGRLLFGGVDGYNVIDPAKIENIKSLPPAVVISAIKIFDREVPPGDGYLKLKYTENSLTFEFAALSFYRNQDNRYAYKIEGIDPDWIYSNDRRFVTYSNLEPGDYIFKVKACNSDGVWNETGTALAITITPPWWETWWFRSLIIIVVVAGVGWFFNYRTASHRKQKLTLENTVEQRTHDLRDQKEIAEQHRMRAERSEKFKQQFLANMSHEIRTPMNAVMGMTELVLNSDLNDRQRNYLEAVKISSSNLLHIINDILDFSKIEAGKIELEQIDFTIRNVIEQVKQTLDHKAEEKGLHLITEIENKIPEVLVGDPVRLNQVLMNLAGNAIKFTEKGSVMISVVTKSEIQSSPDQTGINLQFSITDTGIGIPKDKLQTVFESFTQANTSDTRKFGGTGLGLPISKQLVEIMGGNIFIESEEGSGTTFSFGINYPVGSKERMQEQKSSEQIDGSILNGLKILVVDDNEYNRIVVHDTLKMMTEVEIFQATNGKEAIAAVDQHTFDIILMDIQMPLMNGYQATKYIREKMNAPKNAIPVIALTASVIRSDLDKCRAAGMNDYVPKPFKTSQLISAIAKLTGREIKLTAKRTGEVNPDNRNYASVTNLSYLEKFCQGDKKQMMKFISMFTATAPDLIEKLTTALSKNDFEEIANQVHGYKTKWIMMGMTASKDLALLIERQCREKEPDKSVNENVIKLIKQIQAATKELT